MCLHTIECGCSLEKVQNSRLVSQKQPHSAYAQRLDPGSGLGPQARQNQGETSQGADRQAHHQRVH